MIFGFFSVTYFQISNMFRDEYFHKIYIDYFCTLKFIVTTLEANVHVDICETLSLPVLL